LTPLHWPSVFGTNIHVNLEDVFQKPRPWFPSRLSDIGFRFIEDLAKQWQLAAILVAAAVWFVVPSVCSLLTPADKPT
jgi:hypothetical protein